MNLNRCEQTHTATGYFIATPKKIYLSTVDVQAGLFEFSLSSKNLEGLKALAAHLSRDTKLD